MADCRGCGKKLGFLEGNNGMCEPCFVASLSQENRERVNQEKLLAQSQREREIDQILITTEMHVDFKVLERVTIITAECAYGMNVFKDIFAGVRNIVGGRSEAVQNTMRDARETVLYELKKEAHAVGANAVVGVHLNYTQMGDGGWSMVLLVASGTAVKIER